VAAGACPAPRLPVAGAGYALTLPDGRVLCGATAQPGDMDASVRDSDHRHNLARLQGLTGCAVDAAALGARVGWRVVAPDRLPVAGAVPHADADRILQDSAASGGPPADRVRFVARAPGLFVHTALGSRGIAWAALGARVIASAVTGAPAPLDAGLLDAIDPARFAVRRVRRSAS
jgi:tRNA 5-methylaminomethyl-2-thiouridine biosynthesis bifunctional protein